jgi:hypothetical protein
MSITLNCLIAIFLLMFGSPVHALEPFALYDDFKSKIIDETKWYAAESMSTGVNIVDQVLQSSGKLHMLSRFYGNVSSNSGVSRAFYDLAFANPDTITAMEATVQVKKVEVDGCPDNLTPTTGSAGLTGSFFNTGPQAPTPNSLLSDVLAAIEIRLASDSTDKPNILEVLGTVWRCDDPTCSLFTELNSTKLGSIKVGAKTTLSIQWDQPFHQFIFQFGKLAPIFLPYAVSDTFSPGYEFKRLRIRNYIANCTTGPRLGSFVEAYFDNVFVNQSAAPAP